MQFELQFMWLRYKDIEKFRHYSRHWNYNISVPPLAVRNESKINDVNAFSTDSELPRNFSFLIDVEIKK